MRSSESRNAASESPPADIAARERKFLVTGNSRDLWPDVAGEALRDAATAIEGAMSSLLADRSAALGAADGRDAEAIGIAGLPSGAGAYLGYFVEKGRLDVSDRLARLLAVHLVHGRRRIERIIPGTARAIRALNEAGVTPAIIKGFHAAQQYFPEPALRPFVDVDVLIPPDKVESAERALSSIGFTGSDDIDVPYKRDWIPPGEDSRTWSLDYWHERSPWRIELHDALNFEELVRQRVQLDFSRNLDGRWQHGESEARVATQPLLFSILAIHTSVELFQRRFIRLVELAHMIQQDVASGALDWREAEVFLGEAGALRFTFPAVDLVERLVPGTVDRRFLEQARNASTGLAKSVIAGMTPIHPLMPDEVSIAQRLMWVAGPLDAARRIALMFALVPNVSLAVSAQVYHRRIRRLFGRRVSWRSRS